MYQKLLFFTLKRLFILSVAGVLISVLHSQDLLLMFILAAFTGIVYLRKRKLKHAKIYFLGFAISAIGGILAETWGIESGLWTYHDLSQGREFPYWLPFAWGLAFSFLYSFEDYYIQTLKLNSINTKIVLTLFSSILLPTVGEIITVQLGVWTYNSEYKLFGIPYYAMGLLGLFHTSTFLVLYWVNVYWKTQDPVFSTQLHKTSKIGVSK
ncbi:hypothetical protein [Flavobacterium sp.]|uniref:hypothetical protein n=1 Tax=Flavobacterium sp. TaxID=239 RepID=UPI002622E523|nr:hypothetical protein [Flavobacterium sp.]MDD3004602.1 hypothetical protein [Flavobacterium sp.]